MTKSAGTYHFFSPECCDPDIEAYSGKATDVWSLGVTLFCFIFNELPFWDPELNEFAILEIIFKQDVNLPMETTKRDMSGIS